MMMINIAPDVVRKQVTEMFQTVSNVKYTGLQVFIKLMRCCRKHQVQHRDEEQQQGEEEEKEEQNVLSAFCEPTALSLPL